MDGKRAVVTLHPFSLTDPIPYRSLTFTPNADHVEIGRASKREAKNLAPTNKNGLFDSRVMSRNHAKIRACLDKKVVYICDGGSMHGTRVNGRKLSVGEEVPIKTGDLIIFGTEVTRGRDTYPPLSVRCECQWLGFEESKPTSTTQTTKPQMATNTFCVPDDDDDDDENGVEIVDRPAPVKPTVESISDSEEDSDNGSVANFSPIIPPSKGIDGAVHGGSQQTPIEIDDEQNGQLLATPRMTPSSNEGALAEAEDEAQDQLADSGDSELDSMLDDSEDDLASQPDENGSESDEESMSDSSLESDVGLSDAEDYSVTVHIPHIQESQKPPQAETTNGNKENVTAQSDGQEEHAPSNGAEKSGERLPAHPPIDRNVELPGIHGDVTNPNPQRLLEPQVVLPENTCKPIPAPWSSSKQLYANSRPPLQPYGKIFDHTLTGFHSNSFGREFDEWSSRGNFSSPCSQLRITDLPANGTYRLGSRYHDGPFAHQSMIPEATPDLGPRPGVDINLAPLDNLGNGGISDRSGSDAFNSQSRPDTRLRISDIVSLPQPPTQRAPRKRKVADMESSPPVFPHSVLHNTSDLDYYASNEDPPVGVELEEPCLPDAQPPLDPSGIEDPYTQLTTMSGANEASALDELTHCETQVERPSKRLKKSESKIGSHAATAVVSAVIGAVGTVALLASLPSDYFI